MVVTSTFSYIKQTVDAWSNDKISVWSAALAYYTVFSISPLLLVVIGITGYLFGTNVIETNIFNQLKGLLGEAGAALVQNMIRGASKPSQGIVATITGVVTLLVGASGAFGQLQETFNHIWKVKPKPHVGFIATFHKRLLSFSMVLIIAFLMLVSLIFSAILTSLATFFNQLLPLPGIIFESLHFIVSFVIVSILFMLLFKQLPDVKLRWKDVFIGGLVTAFLFVIGKTAIGLYLGGKSFSSTYGAAASLVVLLVWVYYTTQILFFGAEFTKVFVQNRQGEIIPNKYALVKEPQKRKKGKQEKENVIDAAIKGYLQEKEKLKQQKKKKN